MPPFVSGRGSSEAHAKEGSRVLTLPDDVVICEVGPRDGLQNERTLLSADQKAELIDRMVDAGAKVIEIGSFVHPKAVPAMADTGTVAAKIKRVGGVEYRALVLNKKGVERACEAGVSKAKLTVSASPTHSMQNSNSTPEETIRNFAECADFARTKGVTLSGAIATAFGYYAEGVIGIEKIIPLVEGYVNLGITEISMSDSVGVANPKQVFTYMSKLIASYPQVKWTLHAHDTRGMAMANICAAMTAGVRHFDASFAGIGGCPFAPGASGNIATEDVLNMLAGMDVETGYDLSKVMEIAFTVQGWLGHECDSSMLRVWKKP